MAKKLRGRGKSWKRLETNVEDLSLGFALCHTERGWIRETRKFSLYVCFIFLLPFEILEGQVEAQSLLEVITTCDGVLLLPAVLVLGFAVWLY